jgi:hypothetical protein
MMTISLGTELMRVLESIAAGVLAVVCRAVEAVAVASNHGARRIVEG